MVATIERAESGHPGRPLAPGDIRLLVEREVERAIRRNIKGFPAISTGRTEHGLTPKDEIFATGTLRLFHYRAMADEVYRVPLLILPSLLSKHYILDLAPGRSLAEYLVKQGFDLYLVDWGTPRAEDRGLGLEEYVLDLIPGCVARVLEDCGESQVNILGYCLGGQLALMYAALHENGPLHALACLATPVDARAMGVVRQWCDPAHFDVERIADALDTVPPELLYAAFDLLRLGERGADSQGVPAASAERIWDRSWDDDFVKSYRMFERWGADQVPLTSAAFRQLVVQFLWEDRLRTNRFEIGGRVVDLRRITGPVLHAMAEHDHIAPHAAARELTGLTGSADRADIVMKGGHVSLVAGGNAMYRLWPQLESWLGARSV